MYLLQCPLVSSVQCCTQISAWWSLITGNYVVQWQFVSTRPPSLQSLQSTPVWSRSVTLNCPVICQVLYPLSTHTHTPSVISVSSSPAAFVDVDRKTFYCPIIPCPPTHHPSIHTSTTTTNHTSSVIASVYVQQCSIYKTMCTVESLTRANEEEWGWERKNNSQIWKVEISTRVPSNCFGQLKVLVIIFRVNAMQVQKWENDKVYLCKLLN